MKTPYHTHHGHDEPRVGDVQPDACNVRDDEDTGRWMRPEHMELPVAGCRRHVPIAVERDDVIPFEQLLTAQLLSPRSQH